jgi:hypothetical protein
VTFGAIASRATAAVFRHLSEVALLDELEVYGIFDAPASTQFGDIATTLPSFTLASADAVTAIVGSTLRVSLDGNPCGIPLSVNGTLFNVRSVEPDGIGMTRLVLELAE